MSTPAPRPTPAAPASPRTLSRPVKLALAIGGAILVLAIVVLLARWIRELPAVQSFLTDYTGFSGLPDGAPVGIPAWLGWQHFLNSFFLLLIIRTGWMVRTTRRPDAFWTRKNTGLFRTKGAPQRISLNLWFHYTLDFLWVLNGVIFMVLLFATGQWMRIVPTSWDVIPNALSAALQYASLQWPLENGWVNYNALQVLAYFATTFIAAPLALITGLRMSAAWPARAERLNRIYPLTLARRIHFPVMIYFVAFIVVHVTLVFTTGALKNLGHMYASTDQESWLGFGIFSLSLAVMVGAWFAARPVLLRPLASLTGKVGR
jgi:thiosulfate reductase cytochrome b subunit